MPHWTRHAKPLAVALLAFVVALDLASNAVSRSAPEVGFFDEPAHLATCLLLLLAVGAVSSDRQVASFALAALVATVAIDLDHVPQFLGWDGLSQGVPRPYPHSLVPVVALAAVAPLVSGRTRPALFGIAFGIAAHLLRDLATGPGVALLWPLSDVALRIPYLLFVLVLGGTASALFWDWARRR